MRIIRNQTEYIGTAFAILLHRMQQKEWVPPTLFCCIEVTGESLIFNIHAGQYDLLLTPPGAFLADNLVHGGLIQLVARPQLGEILLPVYSS